MPVLAAVIIQKRDIKLMQILSLVRVIDRIQASQLAGFSSMARSNTRLLKLTRAGLLKRFFFVSSLGGKKAVYCLSKKGAGLIGLPANAINRPADSFLLGDKFVAHQLAINDIYCAARSGHGSNVKAHIHWRVFTEPISKAAPVIPDAYFEIRTDDTIKPMFLEVDLGTESLSVWQKKIEQYLMLATSGEFERQFKRPRFAVVVITTSQRRMQAIRKQVKHSTTKLFYFSTFEQIKREGFWASVWLRPDGDLLQSLI